jgi:hypothetical protein
MHPAVCRLLPHSAQEAYAKLVSAPHDALLVKHYSAATTSRCKESYLDLRGSDFARLGRTYLTAFDVDLYLNCTIVERYMSLLQVCPHPSPMTFQYKLADYSNNSSFGTI